MGVPSGTVTFLFTDIEGSTALWEAAPDSMRVALARHDGIVRGAIESHGGFVFATGGDGFGAAFGRAGDALMAASAAQAALAAEPWPDGTAIRVRMGLHTGEVEERDGDYFGQAVNRAARIMATGHGGQVLVSAATAGVIASPGLTDLGEHSFAGLPAPERVYQAGGGTFAPLRSAGRGPSNLPVERSIFIGRERELAAVAGLVRSNRVVTLTGVGGVGKTRLAIQAASGVGAEFSGGVWLAELAPLLDGVLVPRAVAAAIGAPAAPSLDGAELASRFLAQRRALVVLDNCEHVVEAAAAFVDAVLSRAPRVRVLATSREPLGVVGEVLWRVPSLNLEDDAVELFRERASQVRPGFALEGGTRDAVLAVCRRLDGIPLAIELAAARAKVLSVDQIAGRLDERFRLLTRGGRTAVARQQTLQGAIDWSYELLSQPERELFDSLGVFAGEFDLAAVGAVAQVEDFDALDLVEQLADKSMLEADATRDRYRLLETLRQYAWDRLIVSGRLAGVRDAHASHFLAVAGRQGHLMVVPGRQVAALDCLEGDIDNLRAALSYFVETGQADRAAQMVRRVAPLFYIRHPREGFSWLQRVVAIAYGLPAAARARLLGDVAHAAHNAGDGGAVVYYATAALDIGGDDPPAVALWVLSSQLMADRDFEGAADLARQAVDRAAVTGDLATQSPAMGVLGTSLLALGHRDAARAAAEEAVRTAEKLGNPTVTAAVYMQAAAVTESLDEHTTAMELCSRGMALADAGGPITACVLHVGYAMLTDDLEAARDATILGTSIARNQLSGFYQLYPLLAAARLLALDDKPELAARLLGAYRRHAEATRSGWMHAVNWYDKVLELVSSSLPVPALDTQIERGTHLSLDEALKLGGDRLAKAAGQ